MSASLLVIAVGPVQEFIAAARRTRDLWFGSNLLSEISKATARAVKANGGELIFPAVTSITELDPGSPMNVANIILAELPAANPEDTAARAREAAESSWLKSANEVFIENEGVIRSVIWGEQVGDVIEFYAAWMPLPDPKQYQPVREQLMRLLSGRKNCRNFLRARGHPLVPKSSLDGLRESVLKDPAEDPWPERFRRGLRVREGEQLDVVGLVKRTSGGHRPYPSVSRVAADPWIRGRLAAGRPAALLRLADECANLGGDVLHRIDITPKDGHPHYDAFPYEGTALYLTRHRELKKERKLSNEELKPLVDALLDLTKPPAGEPSPYLAVLVADGDRMGAALSKLESAAAHREFSRQLSLFAAAAKEVVHRHRGVLVYSGGDDVLAFVPIDQCLACARELHERFAKLMEVWTNKTGIPLTLSVGVAMGHFLENLEDLLAFGRAAEKHAKKPRREDGMQQERDGLAVHLHKRGGGPVEIRANWDRGLHTDLADLAALLNSGAIPGRVAYDLLRVADVYSHWPAETVKDAITRDALRVIKAKKPRTESMMGRVAELVNNRVTDARSLRRLGDELLVARQVAIAIKQARGDPAPEVVP